MSDSDFLDDIKVDLQDEKVGDPILELKKINKALVEMMTPEVKELSEEEKNRRKQTEMLAHQKLNAAFAGMLSIGVFYARVMNMFKRICDWNVPVPSLGTRIIEGRIYMWYHPEFVMNVGNIELMDHIEHECLHVLNNHFERGLSMLGVTSFKEANKLLSSHKELAEKLGLATDFAVNYELYRQKNNTRPIEGNYWVMSSDYKMELNRSSEEYFNNMKQESKQASEPDDNSENQCEQGGEGKGKGTGKGNKGKNPGKGQNPLDHITSSHSWYGNSQADDDRTAAEMDLMTKGLKEAISKAIFQQQRARGTVPAAYMQLIDNLFKVREIPWYKILSRKVRTHLVNTKKTSFTKPIKNRLFLIDEGIDVCLYPSKVREHGFTIVYAIDTSGSMSDDDLLKGAGELWNLATQYPGSRLIVIHCDAGIEHEFEIESEDDLQKIIKRGGMNTFHGRGGTDFNPPLARCKYGNKTPKSWYAAEECYTNRINRFPERIDAVIYFTDGYAPRPEEVNIPKAPLFWVITEGGTTDVGSQHGSIIKVNKVEK